MDKTNANCAKGRCSRSRVSVACQTDVDPAAVGACDHTAFDSSSASGKTATSQRRAVFGNVSANTQNGVEPTTSCQRPHNNQAASPARAAEEGTLRVTIQNFSKMSDTLCSPSKRINNVPWRIMVMPKQHMVMKKSQKCMGFFLQCCPDNTYNDQWACQAVAEMRLISQKMGVQNFVRKTTHSYTAKENDWGYSCFMTWADVLDENQGYIKEDKVVLEIHVKAESPKNMMSKQDFLQKLEQWYKLADIHRAKNSVDLAIEANQQAIAYCKDKDKEMLAKLKAQKDVLVKQKLMDSIKRLEAGDKTPTKEEEQPGKMSVRAAINGGGAAKAAGTVKRVQNTAANMKKNHVHAKQTGKTGALKKDEKEKVAKKDSRLLPSATPDQQLSEAESGDDDFLKTNEFREDLDCSLDTCDSVNTLDMLKEMCISGNGKCSSDCALQKRDIDGSDSSLDLETQSSDNCVPVNESVEMNDSECQTEQSLLCSTPFRGILTQTTCGMSSAQHLQPTQAQQGQQQQQTAPLAVLASEALTRSHPVGAVPVAQHRAAAVSQVAVGTTGTRVGGINARVSSILQMPPQVGVKMEEKHRQQLKHVAAFFDEKNGVEVTKQLASLFTEHSVDGTQECVAVVIASHLATLHCNKVMKAMEEFLNGAEGLFKTESVVASLKVLKQNAASICQRAEEERRKKLAAKRIVKNAPREEKEASPPADVEINLTDSESEDADYSDETEADGEEEEDDEEDVAIAVECEDDMKRLRAIQQQPTNEAMEAIRNFALRELYQFNQNMGRAMERLTQLNDAIHVISATLPDFDPKKIVSEMCNHGDLKARVEELERSLAAEQTTHVAAKKVLTECQTHCQDLKNRTEQQNKLMREKTNELKRLEKKSTRDDNRIEELVREKTDLEERVKNMKRDLDALKKKHSEESRNLKNEKDKATKLVTRMEHEATEREHDREKERAALESRVRQLQSELDARTKEVKAAEQKEKKAHAHATHAVQQMQERLRMQEVQTLEMQLAGVCGVFERVKQDAENEVEALEEHIKQCRSVASGSNDNDLLERLERSVLDWKTYVQNSSQNIATLKNEYLPQIESVRKGQKEWNQVQIKSTGPGRLPVILRPQVAPLPPTPGVIGQPRTPQPNSNGFSSPGGQPGFSRAPSPPAEGKRIAPIGARPTATVAPQTVDPLDGQDFGASCLTSLRLGGGIDQWSTWQSPLGGVGLGSIGGSSPSVSLGAPSSTPSSAVSDLSTVLPSRPLFSETPMREWEGAARQLGGGPPGGAPSLPGYPQWATHAHHNSHQQIHHHHGTPNSAGAPPGWPHQAPPPGTPRGHPFKPYMP